MYNIQNYVLKTHTSNTNKMSKQILKLSQHLTLLNLWSQNYEWLLEEMTSKVSLITCAFGILNQPIHKILLHVPLVFAQANQMKTVVTN